MVKNRNEKIEILKLLIETEEPLTIRQISKKRNINYKSAYEAINKLNDLVNIKKYGNTSSHLTFVNRDILCP